MAQSRNQLTNALWYLVVFIIIQVFTSFIGGIAWFMAEGQSFTAAAASLQNGVLNAKPMALITITGVTSIIIILLFALLKWSPFSYKYIRTRPWLAMIWVALLACGSIIPSAWLLEIFEFEMNSNIEEALTNIMGRPVGYIVVGILAPLGEEMVFRGAILRTLLRAFNERWAWIAIAISAMAFGAVHGNMPQFFHATLIGLLLGWMYLKTDSIFPGVVFHWINNSIAFVLANVLPQSQNEKLVELFGGNQQMVWYALGCSLCIFLPSLFQLAIRLRKADN